ncbi:polyribonucleotide nucleotidyltransferase [Candidatus Jorgensenbacteria bacterium RIFCSPLOWO2_12_FULL_42_11]|uniref:Polyribonucleotide nucleotidyltransferase n=1 Tax=Candidatus Jorgensenbacteria bacterium RIFCSPLOWO2_12_FULL_42_11 TaxID=1798473 RepID=A0A1F6C1Q0_9BACT|nr:MAG: polyribonucleotide nucleotidyltransferase [Candidatus Jorgensenbacteria bacterium RIFCSPLOWO2_12_FULL_42_11]
MIIKEFKKQVFQTEFENKNLSLEVSDLGCQANSAVLGKYGETAVLVAVVMGKKDEPKNYLPLVVDYEEKFYAAGKIIGSRFVRREGRPSDDAIISGRLIDRTVRPLFDQRIRRPIQVVVTVLAYDEENDPDFIALLTASTALAISDVPWNGPVAGIKIVKEQPKVEAFFAGTEDKINMIELGAEEISADTAVEFFESSQKKIKELIAFQKGVVKTLGQKKAELVLAEPPAELRKKIIDFLNGRLEKAVYQPSKSSRQNALGDLKTELFTDLKEEPEIKTWGDGIFEEEVDKIVHRGILEKDKRPDSRKLDEVRSLYAETGLFKRTHGSALFVRGDTQSLAITTLAAPGAEQLVETMEFSGKKRFMLHYNFPPFSVGETGPSRGPGRREIGHGLLAEKALRYLIPPVEQFPYTIRVVSEILSSNGSSSMASVCAGSLSLMDAGVPLKKPAVGIAMGLVAGEGQYKILTDIQGPEDHYGDMDLKVAGTRDGLTAIQMDVKIDGINQEIFQKTLAQAQKAHKDILGLVEKTLKSHREELSPYAPVVITFEIKPEKIGGVIGSGGRVIQGIIQMSGGLTTVDVEQDGKIYIAGPDKKQAQLVLDQIKAIVKEYEIGEMIEGEVIKILDFGAIVDLGGGRDGMIHVSELKDGYVNKVEDVVRLGDMIKAKVIRVDPDGKIGLSLKK